MPDKPREDEMAWFDGVDIPTTQTRGSTEKSFPQKEELRPGEEEAYSMILESVAIIAGAIHTLAAQLEGEKKALFKKLMLEGIITLLERSVRGWKK